MCSVSNFNIDDKIWSFDRLIKPLDCETFCQEYWGKRPLHLAHGAGGFAGLISLSEVEKYLSQQDIFNEQSLTMPREGMGLPEPPPTSVTDLYHRMAQGNTLRIRCMERFMDPNSLVLRLARDMQRTLQHPFESLSCYIAPPNSVGLGPHHDDSDIFTLQIAGRKRWSIFHKVECKGSRIHSASELGAPSYDITLQEGDLLYLPRGWIHDVKNREDMAFSLTFVFDPIRWLTIIDLLVDKCSDTPAFLDSIPAGAMLDGSISETIQGAFFERIKILQKALAELVPKDLIDHLAPKLVGQMPLPPDGQLERVLAIGDLTLETQVALRPSMDCYMKRLGDRVAMAGGYSLTASAEAEPALRAVMNASGPFRIEQMHESLSSATKLALAKELLLCGLIRVVQIN